MYSYSSKKRFKTLSILVLIPYIVLCVTAGGFHAFDESAYHGHSADEYHSENTVSVINDSGNSTPILCYNDHNEDNCIICKWLKSSPKKIQLSLDASRFMPDTSGLCLNDQQAYAFLNYGKYSSRSPPLIIS
jgi:hypothetical protein